MSEAAIEFVSAETGPSSVDRRDLQLLAEVSGLTPEACLERLREYRFRELADEWRERSPQSVEDIDRFYTETDLYLWELLAWNGGASYGPYLRRLEELARTFPPERHPRALDYGCGVGTAALKLAELGYAVTIADVPGRTLAFARERFRRRGVEADVLELARDTRLPRGEWDVLVCFDVLEHVADPAAVAKALVDGLSVGGGAAIVAAFDTQGDEWPHHLPAGATRFGGYHWELYLESLGMRRAGDRLYRRTGRAGAVGRRLRYLLWRGTGIYVSRVPR
jgi:2-polyprenyl-3-methyl-5-hydroxy-6-metoxy-1,4-benzoquinol methylase